MLVNCLVELQEFDGDSRLPHLPISSLDYGKVTKSNAVCFIGDPRSKILDIAAWQSLFLNGPMFVFCS